MRLIQTYVKFGECKNVEILNAKPTVLYELAYRCADAQLAELKCGKRLQVGFSLRGTSSLKVKDVVRRKLEKIPLERELATFLEKTQDEISRFHRVIISKNALDERVALKETAKETMKCLKELSLIL
ncbi:hypothetical protein EZJ49_05255 [Bdellovibrio bacteriovorus]|uniref:hypothetical protein n=1 Tax=Bdellovibrio bacteriovorus TaxID=959 RepID=UPI0021D2D1C0|nr:hypothetical protein [Bdellovibrio bacteriovorus]UXR65655.1 hypothetical protein EZJ49_05255 [Bdellovibrio bacteriovorus]